MIFFKKINRSIAAAATLTFVATISSACFPGSNIRQQTEISMNTPAAKTTSNPVRHELEPLTKRFTALGSPIAASWVSGDMGDPQVPGPSLYWIDCIIELNPVIVDDLKARFRPIPTTDRPDVWESLRGSLPQGGFLGSEQLNAAFTSTRLKSKAYLAGNAPVIVITAIGE